MTNTPKYTIFVSYRQADEAEFTARIRDWLAHRYGRENVFLDTDSIRPFINFKTEIRQRLEKSDAVLMIIGTRWLELLNAKAESGDPDHVLFELETALNMKKLIAPVRIKGARMPRLRDVQASLHPLLDIQSATIDSANFYTQIDTLIENLEAALNESRSNAAHSTSEEYFQHGKLRAKDGDRDGAIADYTEAIRLNPQFPRPYNNRGNARHKKGDYDGAIADFTEAIRLDPQVRHVYNNRGISHRNKGDYDSAIADHTEAIRIDPQFAHAYNNRGLSRHKKGDYDGAIADYTEAISSNPNELDAYCNRAASYEVKKDYQKAIADYQKFLDVGGGNRYGNQAQVEAEITRLKRLL